MKQLFLLLGGAVVSLSAACTNPASEPSDSATAPVGGGEGAIVEASDTARTELGVVVWGVDAKVDTGVSTVVRGYDAANEAIVEIRHDTDLRDRSRPATSGMASFDGENAEMQIRGDATSSNYTAYYLRNDFAAKPRAMQAVEIAAADLGKASAAAPARGGLTGQSVHPAGWGTCLVTGGPFAFAGGLITTGWHGLTSMLAGKGCKACTLPDGRNWQDAPVSEWKKYCQQSPYDGSAIANCSQADRDNAAYAQQQIDGCVGK